MDTMSKTIRQLMVDAAAALENLTDLVAYGDGSGEYSEEQAAGVRLAGRLRDAAAGREPTGSQEMLIEAGEMAQLQSIIDGTATDHCGEQLQPEERVFDRAVEFHDGCRMVIIITMKASGAGAFMEVILYDATGQYELGFIEDRTTLAGEYEIEVAGEDGISTTYTMTVAAK